MQELMKAIYNVVDRHGSSKIAAGADFSSRTLLSQKANPNYDSHKLNVEELHRIMKFTQDFEPLRAWADAFGFDLVAKNRPQPTALITAWLNVGKEKSELAIEVHRALEDKHISQIEKQKIRQEITHLREKLDVMEESVKVA